MYFMGSEEFKQYLHSESRLEEIESKNALRVRRAYADIYPTRVGVNYETGKMFSETLDVAEYACYLVDMKDEMKVNQERLAKQVAIFHEALGAMDPEEAEAVKAFLNYDADLEPHRGQRALASLKLNLERVLAAKKSQVPRQHKANESLNAVY